MSNNLSFMEYLVTTEASTPKNNSHTSKKIVNEDNKKIKPKQESKSIKSNTWVKRAVQIFEGVDKMSPPIKPTSTQISSTASYAKNLM